MVLVIDGGQMKYKTLFRLMVKVVGLFLCAQAVPGLAGRMAELVTWYVQPAVGIRWSMEMALMPMLQPVIESGAGLYLFVGGPCIINLAIPSNRPYCPECAYDLRGAVTNRCSECGAPFKMDEVRPSPAVEEAKEA